MVTKTPINIGNSFQQRPIYLYEYLVTNPKLNVLVTGAIHGTEKEGGDSVVRLMEDIEANPSFYSDINIVALPYWNVDGIANGTYTNAQDFAIGYSCLNGATPEMQVLWNYLRDNQYFPDLYIDNHNLDRWCRGAGYYLYNHVPRLALHDNLVIGINNSSFFRHKITWNQWNDLISHVTTNGGGLLYGKFWEIDDIGNVLYNVRYDIGYIDSWLAARCDCLSILIEGVVPSDQTPSNPEWEATKQSQFFGNKYIIDWARTKHPELVNSKCVPPYLGERIPMQQDIQFELFTHRMQVENDSTGSVYYFYANSTRYREEQNNANPLHWITAPLAYAIHNSNEEDLNIFMKWWGFSWIQGLTGDSYDTQVFHCTAADAWDDLEGDVPYQWTQNNVNGYYVNSVRTNFSQYTIYPVSTQELGGDALVYLLEPIAEGNISRHQGLFPTLELVPNDDYPILRLINKRA